ncbi:thiol-disulfide oxidoreductase DCC family protein [Virgibacillus xinjiangensis]|uniref:Thiol-disulfide oxidoreductase DCC family protein n=1 Tax=Virgibacillus xinjiangensis TaxID=393090 RepID=A0ABV7CUC8_9BACI
MIIYYDSYCRLCTASSSLWKKLDWRNKLTFQTFRALEDYPAEMEKSLHVQHKGQWSKGYQAIIEIAKLLPALWILLPFLHLFKWLGLGDYIYGKIASHRRLVPVDQCQGDACRIDTKPKP